MNVRAIIVAGLGFGDEGKGSIVDYLCRRDQAGLIVRYNGGPQAAHNVVTPDGRHHTFSQFGSGTLAGVPTHLSEFMAIDPFGFFEEARHLMALGTSDPCESVTISPRAIVITPYHRAGNRIREILRGQRHGSCGIGYGEAVGDAEVDPYAALRIGDLRDAIETTRKLALIRDRKIDELSAMIDASDSETRHNARSVLEETYSEQLFATFVAACRQLSTDVAFIPDTMLSKAMELANVTIFEGAQGILLDQDLGFFPHVTRSCCTFFQADKLLNDITCDRYYLGVMRCHLTRHGEGPMPTVLNPESPSAVRYLAGDHNQWGPWQGNIRAGFFDAVLARYALDCAGPLDGLALTHADKIDHRDGFPYGYDYTIDGHVFRALTIATSRAHQEINTRALMRAVPTYSRLRDFSIPEYLASYLGIPLHIISSGPKPDDKETR